jgi:putative heme iron utilization protein
VDSGNQRKLVSLVRAQRWAALATLCEDGAPLASSVAYAISPGADGFLLHLSRLAEHTRNLLERPATGLVIGKPDGGGGDPQTLPRFSIQGTATPCPADASAYKSARQAYVARLPHSEPRFEFSDFELFFLNPLRAQYVGGFARAFTLDADGIGRILRDCLDG